MTEHCIAILLFFYPDMSIVVASVKLHLESVRSSLLRRACDDVEMNRGCRVSKLTSGLHQFRRILIQKRALEMECNAIRVRLKPQCSITDVRDRQLLAILLEGQHLWLALLSVSIERDRRARCLFIEEPVSFARVTLVA